MRAKPASKIKIQYNALVHDLDLAAWLHPGMEVSRPNLVQVPRSTPRRPIAYVVAFTQPRKQLVDQTCERTGEQTFLNERLMTCSRKRAIGGNGSFYRPLQLICLMGAPRVDGNRFGNGRLEINIPDSCPINARRNVPLPTPRKVIVHPLCLGKKASLVSK